MADNNEWEECLKLLDEASAAAEKRTTKALASNISSLTRLTDQEITAICPTVEDSNKLAKLMSIIKDATDHNEKVRKIEQNATEFAGIIIKLVDVLT